MPAPEWIGLEDSENLVPVSAPAGQEPEKEALGAGAGRMFDWGLKDDALVTQQSIFKEELAIGSQQN